MDDIHVRLGTPEDLDGMMKMAMEATYENGFLDPDPAKLLQQIYPSLQMDGGVIGIIGKPGERIEAAILIRMGELWYSDQPTLEEKAIYVDPEFRSAKGGRAKKLADFAKKYSDNLGIPLAIGVLSSSRTAAKIKLYERVFGQPAGVYFLYNAQTGLTEGQEGAG
jgi:GNAT superfamily N-acetyltransferase